MTTITPVTASMLQNQRHVQETDRLPVSPVPEDYDTLAVRFLMQQFLNDMYSPVEDCPFSVNYKPDW